MALKVTISGVEFDAKFEEAAPETVAASELHLTRVQQSPERLR